MSLMTWEEEIKKQYEWAEIQSQLDELLFELYKAEDEEEAGIYLMKLHLDNKEDLDFFEEKERKEVRRLLEILKTDTKKHRDMLEEAVTEIEDRIRKQRGQSA